MKAACRQSIVLGAILCTGCSVYTEKFSFSNLEPSTNSVAMQRNLPGGSVTNQVPEPLAPMDVPEVDSSPDRYRKVYTVRVRHFSLFQWGRAARLQTATRTREFVRSINAVGLESGTDAEALKAVVSGAVEGAFRGAKGGIP